MKSDRPDSPRFVVPVAEMLGAVAIVSGFFAFCLPAVEVAREHQRLPPAFPLLLPLHKEGPWRFLIGTPIVVTTVLAAFLMVVRLFLPESVRRHFCWRSPSRG